MLKSSPVRVVPPARVDFTAEDRQWIADRIQKVLASGRLTLGTYGEEFERPAFRRLSRRQARCRRE
jgi:dTDP-4-amino-4,6-dideoxygalactose transaminase